MQLKLNRGGTGDVSTELEKKTGDMSSAMIAKNLAKLTSHEVGRDEKRGRDEEADRWKKIRKEIKCVICQGRHVGFMAAQISSTCLSDV